MKNFYNKVRLWLNLDKEIKCEIISKGFGTPIKLLEKKSSKFSTCPANSPSEYCSRDNLKETKLFLTDLGKKVEVEELYEGLNFEAPCDNYSFKLKKTSRN